MAVLAKADAASLDALWQHEAKKPAYRFIRQPEVGLVMARGRIGGSGAPFNLGEVTVTRCAVETENAVVGHAYVMGRDSRHAELAAVFDAMLQSPRQGTRLWERIVAPLARTQAARRRQRSAKAAATKVEFFTLVRGED
jgi:alpha-D-ribose 1-methylphosphonate 5-triphosphate synthase subunit PhnG